MRFRCLLSTSALLLAAFFARDARAADVAQPSPPAEAPAGQSAEPGAGATLRSRVTDPADGKIDLSRFLAKPRAFLPLPLVVTEPAVGYGLGPLFRKGGVAAEDALGRRAALWTLNGEQRAVFRTFENVHTGVRWRTVTRDVIPSVLAIACSIRPAGSPLAPGGRVKTTLPLLRSVRTSV